MDVLRDYVFNCYLFSEEEKEIIKALMLCRKERKLNFLTHELKRTLELSELNFSTFSLILHGVRCWIQQTREMQNEARSSTGSENSSAAVVNCCNNYLKIANFKININKNWFRPFQCRLYCLFMMFT